LRLFNEFVTSKLVSFWFQYFAQNYFNTNAQQTVGMASINQEQLGAMPLPLMSSQEQKLIADEIENRFIKIGQAMTKVETSIKQNYQLQKSILKKAFEGRLIPQDPNDEPAELLLEKIRQEKSKVKGKNYSSISSKKDDSRQMKLV
jgi:type I restriction enzyme, S subunit